MKKYDVCVIKGDGIGPEIIEEAIKVLDAVSHKFNFELNFDYRGPRTPDHREPAGALSAGPRQQLSEALRRTDLRQVYPPSKIGRASCRERV